MMNERLTIAIEDPKLLEYLRPNFRFQYRIDPQVHCFSSDFIPTDLKELLTSKISDFDGVVVHLYIVDNSDFGCETTYRVELGVKQKDWNLCAFFGHSSPFCASIEAAYKEAVMSILFQSATVPRPSIVAWRKRDM